MDYDHAVTIAQPSSAIKLRFYSQHIEPFLTQEPLDQEYQYFLDQGWDAWRLNVKEGDRRNMKFVIKMCSKLYEKMGDNFVEVVTYMLDEIDDAQTRMHISEKNFYEAKNIGEKFICSIRHYKTYFETAFRIWGTVPFYYACKILGLKNSGSTPETYVKISAGTKFHMLKGIQTILPDGDIKDLVIGFDNELRNAGEGHDSYEITDNDTVILHVLDPKTGKPTGSKKREFTVGQLEKEISLCRKSIWVLRNGLSIFLNNNPEFKKKFKRHRPIKISEIKSAVKNFAETRKISILSINITKDRQNVEMSMKFDKQLHGKGGELLFGNGERYDLITIRKPVKAKNQILSIFQMVVWIFGKEQIPKISATIYNENNEKLTQLQFDPNELKKFFLPREEKNIPKVSSGEIPDFDHHYIEEIKVPYGFKLKAIALLKKSGYDVIG